MANAGAATVLVAPRFTGFQRQLGQQAEQGGRTMGSRLSSALGRAARVGMVAAGVAAGSALTGGIQTGLQMQKTEAALSGLLGSASGASSVMREIREISRTSPIDSSAYYDTAEALAYMGVEAKDMPAILDNLGKMIVGAGGGSQEMQRASEAMLQMVNSGRVYTAQLNQMSDAGVPIFSSLAAHFDTSIANVREMATAGEIGIEDVLAVTREVTGDTAKAQIRSYEGVQQTASSQFSILKGNVTDSLGTMFQPGIDAAAGFLQSINAMMSGEGGGLQIPDVAQPLIDSLTSLWDTARTVGGQIAGAIGNIVAAFAPLARDVGSIAITALTTAFNLLRPVLSAVGTAIAAVGGFVRDNAIWFQTLGAAVLGGVVAFKAASAAMAIKRGIMLAAGAAAKVYAAAQRMLNMAMRGNPIMLIVTLLGALVGAIVYAWNNSETFRNVVLAVWDAIKNAVSTVWNRFLNPIFDWFVQQLQEIWNTALTFRDILIMAWNAVRDGLSAAWRWINSYVIQPIGSAFQWVWEKAVQLKDIAVLSWQIMRDQLGAAWRWISNYVIGPIGRAFNWVWERAVAIKDGVVAAWWSLYTRVHNAYSWLRDYVLDPVIGWFQSVWDKAVEIAGGIADAFNGVKETISEAFSAIWEGIKSPINVVIEGINKYIIGGINAVTGVFGISEIKDLPTLHTGGLVPGTGEKPYMLLGGEAVLNPSATRALGKDNVDRLNRGEAMGGPVDWLKDRWNDYWNVKGAVDQTIQNQVADWLRQGAAYALGKVIDVGRGALRAIPGESFAEEWMHGGLGHFKDEIVAWGKGKDALEDDSSSPKGVGRISKEGWIFPLPPGSFRVGRGSAAHGYLAHDFPAPMGTLVRAPFAGQVQQTNLGNRSYGRHLRLRSGGRSFLAAHLSGYGKSGMVVQGDTIGRVGSTGNSTGPHLHVEASLNGRKVNPRSVLSFDEGGYIPPGVSSIVNGSRSPEPVLTSRQWDAVSELAGRGAALDAGAIREAMAGMEVVLVADDREIARSTNRGQAVIARRR